MTLRVDTFPSPTVSRASAPGTTPKPVDDQARGPGVPAFTGRAALALSGDGGG
ncbi:hypothetical protein [Methanoculleus chikugoensis]|uniref:hypothetical protein n=1 Tax=Methanoculleus chikugoensis TaxID=118126 RepID=UPI001C82323E|nr:hypothetical protein [Methanoculleus chikugoensis]